MRYVEAQPTTFRCYHAAASAMVDLPRRVLHSDAFVFACRCLSCPCCVVLLMCCVVGYVLVMCCLCVFSRPSPWPAAAPRFRFPSRAAEQPASPASMYMTTSGQTETIRKRPLLRGIHMWT